jgi:hypothetical protein
MRPLLVIAALAAGTAVLSGILLLKSTPSPPRSGDRAARDASSRDDESSRRSSRVEPDAATLGRIAALEARIDELTGRLSVLADQSTAAPRAASSEGDAATGASAGEAADADAEGKRSLGTNVPEEFRAWYRELQETRRTRDREVDLESRLNEAVTAMSLQPAERGSLEGILRRHSDGLEDLSRRSAEEFRTTGFGMTEVEKQRLKELDAERRKLDQDRDAAAQNLVGAERWKTYQKARKDEIAKMRTLRRLGQP